MVMTLDAIVATRANLESVMKSLKPLVGSYWLVMDRSTRCHWVIEAAAIQQVRGSRYTSEAVIANLASINSLAGTPMFTIEVHDRLTWAVPGETLIVQEGRFRGSETVLQRLDDIDAPTISRESLDRHLRAGEIMPAIRTRDSRYVEIAECLLPTGDVGVDDELMTIEATIRTRLALQGSEKGTEDVLRDLDRRLDALAGTPGLESFIWLTAQRELIQRLLQARRV